MQLTEKEKQIIQDKEFLTLKISIINKVINLFEQTQKILKKTIEESGFNFPADVDIKHGKIFRGENYNLLPYVVLDYPKLFSKTNIFAFRTMFWWGNFFSTTLHLEGDSLNKYRDRIITNIEPLLNSNIYVCVNDTPWDYHYNKDNYVVLTKNNFSILKEVNFIKLSKYYNLAEYSKIPSHTDDFLKTIISLLS